MITIKKNNLVYLYLTITVSAWGSLYVASKYVLDKIPVFTVLFLRYFIAGIVLFFFFRKNGSEKIARKDYKYIFFIGFIGYFLAIGAQLTGTKLSNASFASLINSMNPVFIILFAALILNEKLTINKVISVMAAIFGTYIITGGGNGTGQILGVLLSFVSVISWSLMTVIVRKVTQKYDSFTITTYGIIIAMFCALPVSIYELHVTADFDFVLEWKVIFSLIYIGVVCTAMAHMLWNKSISMIEAGRCSLFYPIQAMVSVLLGWIILGENIDIRFIFGAVFIVAGVLFSILGKKKEILYTESLNS
ncbi:MAG: EamA family transporter [Firmicutes bacterium]|nr:EamA family transporter [Bacillota bacterium]